MSNRIFFIPLMKEQESSEIPISLLEKFNWLEKLPAVIICGILLSLSIFGYSLSWLAWLGLVPLLLLVRSCQSKFEALITGTVFGLAYELMALKWILQIGANPAIPWWKNAALMQTWFIEALQQSLVFALFALFIYILPMRAGYFPHFRRPFVPYLLAVPIIWIFLQSMVVSGFMLMAVPINVLAYSQCQFPEMLQIAKIGGSQSIEFLIVLINAAIAAFIVEFTNLSTKLFERSDLLSAKAGVCIDLCLSLIIVSAVFSWGHARLLSDQFKNTYFAENVNPEIKKRWQPPVTVAILQPGKSEALSISDLIAGYKSIATGIGASLLIVPPENKLETNRQGVQDLHIWLGQLAGLEKKEIIVSQKETAQAGVNLISDVSPKENSCLQSPHSANMDFLSLKLNGDLEQILGAHVYAKARLNKCFLNSIWGKIGVLTMGELFYPEFAAQQASSGSNLLLCLIDKFNCSDPSLRNAVMSAAIMRAAETGRFLVLVNDDIAAVIDPCGVVTSTSLPGRKGVLIDRVQFIHKRTFFTKMWWLWRQ